MLKGILKPTGIVKIGEDYIIREVVLLIGGKKYNKIKTKEIPIRYKPSKVRLDWIKY